MADETISIETDTSAAEQAASLSALSVETGLALSDEIKAQNEDLRIWLTEQLSTSREETLNLSTSVMSSREQLQTILERIAEISENQKAMAESLLSIQSQETELETPETIVIVDPATETESPPESDAEDQRDISSDHVSQKKRRVRPL